MTRYFDPENQRYQFMVRESVNGYAIQVLSVPNGVTVPLSPSVASQLNVTLPDTYRMQCCTRQAAEKELARIAPLNSWIQMTDETL